MCHGEFGRRYGLPTQALSALFFTRQPPARGTRAPRRAPAACGPGGAGGVEAGSRVSEHAPHTADSDAAHEGRFGHGPEDLRVENRAIERCSNAAGCRRRCGCRWASRRPGSRRLGEGRSRRELRVLAQLHQQLGLDRFPNLVVGGADEAVLPAGAVDLGREAQRESPIRSPPQRDAPRSTDRR